MQGESIQAGNLVSRQKRIPGAAGPTPPVSGPDSLRSVVGGLTASARPCHLARQAVTERVVSCISGECRR